jgi:hypothetical protein
LIAGSRATKGCEPRQVRKEAAAAITDVCRGGAWLSFLFFYEAAKISPPELRTFYAIEFDSERVSRSRRRGCRYGTLVFPRRVNGVYCSCP